jgi:CHAD domain-containing protein
MDTMATTRPDPGITIDLEREVKLTLPDGASVDAVGAGGDVHLGPSEQRLYDATYYDTPDRRLLRTGLTLRHRSGEGGSPGTWTLKVDDPGADGVVRRRWEVKVEATAAVVPEPLLRMVAMVRRGVDVGPIARLLTARTVVPLELADAAVAELAQDTVSVLEAGRVVEQFQETEVECAPGAPDEAIDAVVAALRAAGAEDAPSGTKVERAAGPLATTPPDPLVPAVDDDTPLRPAVQAVLGEQVRLLLAQIPVVVVDGSVDGVHDARVATRRLRSHLKTLSNLLDPAPRDALWDELKWLGRQLGAVRDLDVFLARLERTGDALEPGDRAGLDALTEHYRAERASALDELREAVCSERAAAIAQAAVAFVGELPLTEDPLEPAAPVLERRAQRAFRKVARRARDLDVDSPMPDLHRLRIKAKQARYAAEATELVGGPGKVVSKLRDLQDTLGELHDTGTAEERLRHALGDVSPGQAFAAGLVVAKARAEAMTLRQAWPHQWRRARAAADH